MKAWLESGKPLKRLLTQAGKRRRVYNCWMGWPRALAWIFKVGSSLGRKGVFWSWNPIAWLQLKRSKVIIDMILYPLNRGQAISPTSWIPTSENCFSVVASFKVYSLTKKSPGLGGSTPLRENSLRFHRRVQVFTLRICFPPQGKVCFERTVGANHSTFWPVSALR